MRISIPDMRIIHKAITAKARPKTRFAAWLMLLAKNKSVAKVSPINMAPSKARSYKLIWDVYLFKRVSSSNVIPII